MSCLAIMPQIALAQGADLVVARVGASLDRLRQIPAG